MVKIRKTSATDMEHDGIQYHIGLKRGELADSVILCGEIERVEKVARFFSRVRVRRQKREYVTVTGTYRGIPVSVMGTGIGPDNTEIALVESMRLIDAEKAVFIRVGSSGSLQDFVRLGDAVISTASVRLENTSLYYVPEGYPAVADCDVVAALRQSARELGKNEFRYHVGITATTPSFYGAQCRNVGFPLRFPGLIRELTQMGVLNLEMETSTLFTLCSLRKARAGAICAAYTDRLHDTVIEPKEKRTADRNCIRTALNALVRLQTT
jgi:uridine phosphorylase